MQYACDINSLYNRIMVFLVRYIDGRKSCILVEDSTPVLLPIMEHTSISFFHVSCTVF